MEVYMLGSIYISVYVSVYVSVNVSMYKRIQCKCKYNVYISLYVSVCISVYNVNVNIMYM